MMVNRLMKEATQAHTVLMSARWKVVFSLQGCDFKSSEPAPCNLQFSFSLASLYTWGLESTSAL